MANVSKFQEEHAKRLIDSFKAVTGRDLIGLEAIASIGQQSFEAPFVVVSHNGGDDLVQNYRNLTALNLWEMAWEDFTRTPSRR
ncbi:MEKHLA domain-containing protein [Kiloniella sp. EL199]|uniref:MEKHLA domain-containing protein n=1 Tax=Kiloniella sp. EL199 TaxID=2107581 RepID=UPI001C1F3709|nr:MEKHLA domain-containing protein [Kiloniella sp. EL199]